MDKITQNWDLILVTLLIGLLLGIYIGGKLFIFIIKKKVELKGYDFLKLIR